MGLFDNISLETVFANKNVLRHSYVPDFLPHRSAEIETIVDLLSDVLRGVVASNFLGYGRTGTGKTVTLRVVGQELESKALEMQVRARTVYVNCRRMSTPYGIYYQIGEGLGLSLPVTGLSVSQLYRRVHMAIEESRSLVVVVLDEVDRVSQRNEKTNVIYNLTRANSDLRGSGISVVGLSNRLDYRQDLDPGVLSSLGEEKVVFRDYNVSQLGDILRQRVALGFKSGAVEEMVVQRIAAAAAYESGDARKALELLRAAGEEADRDRVAVVRAEHVDRAQARLKSDVVREFVMGLREHPRLVLEGLLQLNSVPHVKLHTGEVYRLYKRVCEERSLSPQTLRSVSDILSEFDMQRIISAPVSSQGRGGRSRSIGFNISPVTLRGFLQEAYGEDGWST